MRLRPLEIRDAAPMLAWMHDPDTVSLLNADFGSKTLSDCLSFIEASRDESVNLHRAVADDADRYLGTVSLKAIDRDRGSAEFAITVGPEARGSGAAAFAMKEILRLAFDTLSLKTVYWYVNPHNLRAIRFYEKQGFLPVDIHFPDLPVKNPDPGMVWFLLKEACLCANQSPS